MENFEQTSDVEYRRPLPVSRLPAAVRPEKYAGFK